MHSSLKVHLKSDSVGYVKSHGEQIEQNPQIVMIDRNFDKIDEERDEATLKRAERLLEDLDSL